jgi:hypothetical protein
MANQRLFPESDDKREPQKKFDETASKVFSVPKSEIDKREKEWRDDKLQLKPKS